MGIAAIAVSPVASQVALKECVNVEFSLSTAFQSQHGVKRLLLNIPVGDCQFFDYNQLFISYLFFCSCFSLSVLFFFNMRCFFACLVYSLIIITDITILVNISFMLQKIINKWPISKPTLKV